MVMDSVEVPLPANVVVAKLLGKEGFGGSFAESEIGAPSAPFYSHLDKFSPAIICNSSQAGSSNLGIPVSVCKSGSRCALKAEISCSPYDSLFVSSDGNVFRESSFQASEKSLLSKLHENIEKGMESKTGRAARNGGSGRKGSRSSFVEESLHLVNDTGITPLLMEKIGLNDASCAPICNEKLRINRKHGHSGKKGDKRNCKLVQTTGGDSFGWKIGSINSNLIAAQNNILGIYGLKSEPVNVSKYIADLTLTDLLYGHFEVASFSQTDGKQIDNNNVNVLQAVQNVCQLLPSRSMTSIKNVSTIESNCNVKDQISRSSVDANTVERVNFDVKLGDSMDQEKVPVEASSTIQDVCDREPSEAGLRAPVKATLRSVFPVHNLPLYQPEEFLRHLKLPSVETVDSLLSQTPIQGVAGVQCLSALHSKTQTVGSIPPFPWSLLLGGPCKINLDPGRLSGNQIANQRCWVRIDTIKSMTSYCLSESQSLNFQNDGAIGLESGQISAMPASEKKVNRCLNSPTGIALVDEGVSCHSCQLASPAVAKRDIGLAKITSLIDSGHQSDSKISEVNNYSFHCCYKKWGHGDEQCIGKASSVEANLKAEESETCMGQVASDCPAGSTDKHLQKTRKLMILNQEAANTKNDFALASSLAATAAQFRQSNGTSRSHVQHDTPVSPRLLAAAQILYGMAHCLPYQDEESQNIEKNRGKAFESWPGAPSQKAAKSQKTRHSMGKDAVLELPEQAQMKELKSKEGGVSVLQNKVPVLERRKSLSQVNDMISRPTKHLASSTDRVPAGTTTGIKDTRNVGHSPDAKGIKTVRGLLDQARENSGDVDTGLVSLAGIPLHEISLKDVPREPHAQAVISTVIPLPAQKGGMTGGLKFSRGHSPDRGNGEASVKRLKPSQSHVTWANSSHLLGSSFRIQRDDVQLRSAAENALLQAATILFDGESNATANSGIQRYGAPNLTRLLIVGSQAGSLIGKGGATIKDIRESSGATVRILPPDQLPMCSCAFQGDRLIQISGEIPQVQKALELIGAKLRENPAKEITPANPGFILGAQQQMLLSQTASAGYEGSSGCISHQGSIPGLPSYGGVFLQTGVPGLPKVTAEMSVPSALMGGIIGRGGANITQIRTISGCAIKVFGEKDGAPERTIAFGGTPDQVSAAQSLVQAFLNAQ